MKQLIVYLMAFFEQLNYEPIANAHMLSIVASGYTNKKYVDLLLIVVN